MESVSSMNAIQYDSTVGCFLNRTDTESGRDQKRDVLSKCKHRLGLVSRNMKANCPFWCDYKIMKEGDIK